MHTGGALHSAFFAPGMSTPLIDRGYGVWIRATPRGQMWLIGFVFEDAKPHS